MRNWTAAFKSYKNSGIYSVETTEELASIELSARNQGLAYLYIDLSGVTDKEALLQKIAGVLGFPSYYGGNWDALEECITDLSWLKAKGFVLVFDNADALVTHNPQELQTLQSILRSAVASWKNQKTPFYAFVARTAIQ